MPMPRRKLPAALAADQQQRVELPRAAAAMIGQAPPSSSVVRVFAVRIVDEVRRFELHRLGRHGGHVCTLR